MLDDERGEGTRELKAQSSRKKLWGSKGMRDARCFSRTIKDCVVLNAAHMWSMWVMIGLMLLWKRW